MSAAFFLVLALAPATLWLWYFCRHDKNSEPWGLVAAVFTGGILCVYPVYIAQHSLIAWGWLPKPTPDMDVLTLFGTLTILAGVLEEVPKFLIVLSIYLWRHEFDEPVDGMVYGLAVALGFTAAEDFIKEDWTRAFSPPGHALFALIWAHELGQTLNRPRWGWWSVAGALVVAILVHAFWDTLAFFRLSNGGEWVCYLIFPFCFGLFFLLETRLARTFEEHHAAEAAKAKANAELADGTDGIRSAERADAAHLQHHGYGPQDSAFGSPANASAKATQGLAKSSPAPGTAASDKQVLRRTSS